MLIVLGCRLLPLSYDWIAYLVPHSVVRALAMWDVLGDGKYQQRLRPLLESRCYQPQWLLSPQVGSIPILVLENLLKEVHRNRVDVLGDDMSSISAHDADSPADVQEIALLLDISPGPLPNSIPRPQRRPFLRGPRYRHRRQLL